MDDSLKLAHYNLVNGACVENQKATRGVVASALFAYALVTL